MSIYGAMRTGASGMAAQSNRLGTVAENIANASTTGYREASTEFSSLLVNVSSSSYSSGGVETSVRYGISQQGTLAFSNSPFDLAITGSGFFVVADPSGKTMLTRAGAFVPDDNGQLVNAAGYTLLGIPAAAGGASGLVLNGMAGLQPIVVNSNTLQAEATTAGLLTANLPANSDSVAAADLPSLNAASSLSTARSSMVVYGDLGQEIILDIHFAHTATPGEWEVAVYDAAGRSAGGGFPYSAAALAQDTLVFASDGTLDAASPASLSIQVPGGAAMTLDLSRMTQLSADYTVLEVNADGNAPSDVASIEIAGDGTVYETYENGTRRGTYRITLADVMSPDRLNPITGNVFEPTSMSGDVRLGFPDEAGMGSVVSGALENSTVDLADQLTDMIEAQRNYTANSRVFQTGAELLDVLVNLKR
ncbi:MAG: flagellar hook protein FlgE [Hyphomicrobiaceae bacterium]|nr:flagellar hook protein FlgE [Hyphomicrobiaceae bacterium]